MQNTILVADAEDGRGGVSCAERDHILDAEPVGISQVRRHGLVQRIRPDRKTGGASCPAQLVCGSDRARIEAEHHDVSGGLRCSLDQVAQSFEPDHSRVRTHRPPKEAPGERAVVATVPEEPFFVGRTNCERRRVVELARMERREIDRRCCTSRLRGLSKCVGTNDPAPDRVRQISPRLHVVGTWIVDKPLCQTNEDALTINICSDSGSFRRSHTSKDIEQVGRGNSHRGEPRPGVRDHKGGGDFWRDELGEDLDLPCRGTVFVRSEALGQVKQPKMVKVPTGTSLIPEHGSGVTDALTRQVPYGRKPKRCRQTVRSKREPTPLSVVELVRPVLPRVMAVSERRSEPDRRKSHRLIAVRTAQVEPLVLQSPPDRRDLGKYVVEPPRQRQMLWSLVHGASIVDLADWTIRSSAS